MPQGGAASMTLDVPAIRAAYPALADGYAYLDGAAGTQVPGSVIDAIGDAYRSGLGNAGGVFPASIRSTTVTEQCRRAVADLVGGAAEGVILGPNMTTLTYRLAGTLARSWRPGRVRRSGGPRSSCPPLSSRLGSTTRCCQNGPCWSRCPPPATCSAPAP